MTGDDLIIEAYKLLAWKHESDYKVAMVWANYVTERLFDKLLEEIK